MERLCACGQCGQTVTGKNKFRHGHWAKLRKLAYSPDEQVRQFWAKVDKRGPDECWPWTGACSSYGYGNAWLDGKIRQAHVVAYELVVGPLPTDKPCGLHSCDNPPCCNPGHIFPGTKGDNAIDMSGKDRHGMAKLTVEQVKEIAEMVDYPGRSQQWIADRFGVSRQTINDLANGRYWSEVTGFKGKKRVRIYKRKPAPK